MIIVKASKWHERILDNEREGLIKMGIVPINDVFYNLWDSDATIFLTFGGYGSGKSDFHATHMISESRKKQYYKGYFGRKIEDKVRESCHSKLVSVIERHNLQHEFKYSKEANGTMVIKHIATGNILLPFGAKNADDMKSVDDPTDIWMEETDQFEEKDLQVLLSRLRTPKSKYRLRMSFNTGSVYTEHWLLKYFFPEHVTNGEINQELVQALANVKTEKVFCNYSDNYFINQEEYYNMLVLAAAGNAQLLDSMARGAWGAKENKNPFFYSYRHYTTDGYKVNPQRHIDLSFDFNKSPTTITIGQHLPELQEWHIFDIITADTHSFVGLSPIQAACKYFEQRYIDTGICQKHLIRVMGDSSGSAGSADRAEAISFYSAIQDALKLQRGQIQVRSGANYEHTLSRTICNYVLYHIDNIFVHPMANRLHTEIGISFADEKGTLNTAKKELGGLHTVDSFRYLMEFWFPLDKYRQMAIQFKTLRTLQNN